MATLSTELKTIDSNKILYYYKLSTWDKAEKAKILGLQGATSGTNSKQLQTTQTKQGSIKTAGTKNQQRVVAAYYQQDSDLYKDLKSAWKDDDTIVHLYRVDLNTVSGETGKRTAECEYSQCLLPNLPFTEGLSSALTSSLTFEVNGIAQDGVIGESEFEEGAFDQGRAFYDFMKPTEVGESVASGSPTVPSGGND